MSDAKPVKAAYVAQTISSKLPKTLGFAAGSRVREFHEFTRARIVKPAKLAKLKVA